MIFSVLGKGETKESKKGKDSNNNNTITTKQEEGGQQPKRKRAPPLPPKEIIAVQTTNILKTLKKSRRMKATQSNGSQNWQLPMYKINPFLNNPLASSALSSSSSSLLSSPAQSPAVKASRSRKRAKREDPTRFKLQLTASFEEGICAMDECIFEDQRAGVQMSDVLTRKFTPRKILRKLCKALWNTKYWGVLTNNRRRSLYEGSVFERRLREVYFHLYLLLALPISIVPNVIFFSSSSYREELQHSCSGTQ